MEKITASQFGKFEGFELMNSTMIKGGLIESECTGGGGRLQSYMHIDCSSYAIVDEWDSDSIDSEGAITYTGYKCTWYSIPAQY